MIYIILMNDLKLENFDQLITHHHHDNQMLHHEDVIIKIYYQLNNITITFF